MGRGNQMKEWVAHVKLDGKIMEVTVWDTSRTMAVDSAMRKLGLTGPDDERIQFFRIAEANDIKASMRKSEPVEVPEVPKRDKTKDKRYRVRLYLSPLSRDMKSRTIQTKDAQNALWSVMNTYGIRKQSDLGPYIVEEERPTGRVTLLFNQIHNFEQRGPLVLEDDGYAPAPRQTPRPSGYVEDQMTTTEDLDKRWDDAMADLGLGAQRTAQAERFVEKVNDIFKTEKKVALPNVKIVKR